MYQPGLTGFTACTEPPLDPAAVRDLITATRWIVTRHDAFPGRIPPSETEAHVAMLRRCLRDLRRDGPPA